MLQRTLPAGFIAPCLPTKTERGDRCGLFHSFEHQFNYPTTGPRRIGPLHLISGDRDRSWLRSTYPVRKSAVLDFQREVLVRYSVGAVGRDTPFHDRCVLLRTSRIAVV